MTSIEEVARTQGISLTLKGGLPLVAQRDASKLASALAAMGFLILGADGFRIDAGSTRPDMDLILDLSSVTNVADALLSVQRFLSAARDPRLFFEFTVLSPAEQESMLA